LILFFRANQRAIQKSKIITQILQIVCGSKRIFYPHLILFFRANQRAIQKSKIITQTESSEDKKRAKKISPPFKKPLFQLTVPPGIVVV
jgi:hypothetical protein